MMIKLLSYKISGVRKKVGLAAPVLLLGKVCLDPPRCKNLLQPQTQLRDDLSQVMIALHWLVDFLQPQP